MGLDDEPARLYAGPPHAWRAPLRGRPFSFLLFGFAAFVVASELLFVALDFVAFGYIRPASARGFAAVGLALLVVANLKSLVLPMRREANEALAGLLDVLLERLWLAHFWLNPLGLFSLGLFLLFAPRAQPPFYFIAYGVLLWQATGGLLAREAFPIPGGREALGKAARAAHHQPAVYVLLAVLAAAGFVDSLFP